MSSENTITSVGQVNVTKAHIVTSTGKRLDILGLISDLTFYEDIFSNTMSGYILIQDALDLIEELPLIGQENFELVMQTPTLSEKIEKTFYIYKMKNRIIDKRSTTYMLHFCSLELISSSNSKVSKAFSGDISDTVVSIYSDNRYLASKSLLYVDKTKNSYSFIAPFWTPLETINWLAGKSLNNKGVPNYLFFESNKSFEFVSIDIILFV